MRPRRIAPAALAFALLIAAAQPTAAQFWNPFKSKQAEASPAATSSSDPVASLALTQNSGPWLIMATTFSGDGAEEQARQLCLELRHALGKNVYLHDMRFDFTKDQPVGRGVDKYGQPIKMQYRAGNERREWAVLVGDYPSVDDTLAARDLSNIKTLQPEALAIGEDGKTNQSLAAIRRTQQAVLKQLGKQMPEGPMRTAFLTRNPLLPEEYFVPKGVDKFVEKMNKGLDHSLLKADGRYTVKVATFRGRGVLQGASNARSSAAKSTKRKNDPLVEAAENAHLLCELMRERGWDAYEFHDRNQSYVTVGSFDTVAKDGSQASLENMKQLNQLRNEVIEIVRTFGAAYDTPAAPLETRRGVRASEARVEEVKQTFNQLFTSEVGQVASGLHPKYAQVTVEKGKPPRPVPFDVHPLVIEVPKRTVSSTFAWRR